MESGIIFLLIVVVIGGFAFAKYLRDKYLAQRVKEMYDSKHTAYDAILQQYIPYYRNLDAVQKDRFLKRALIFKATKHFEFVEMQVVGGRWLVLNWLRYIQRRSACGF